MTKKILHLTFSVYISRIFLSFTKKNIQWPLTNKVDN